LQPGQWPFVSNVFHDVPQPGEKCSGAPVETHCQRLAGVGSQPQLGQRIRIRRTVSRNFSMMSTSMLGPTGFRSNTKAMA
jgi:hypothetical protein